MVEKMGIPILSLNQQANTRVGIKRLVTLYAGDQQEHRMWTKIIK